MELASELRKITVVAVVAYFGIMFPPIETTFPDIGPIDGKPTGSVERSRTYLAFVPAAMPDSPGMVQIEIEWPRYLAQLAFTPIVAYLLFRKKKGAVSSTSQVDGGADPSRR